MWAALGREGVLGIMMLVILTSAWVILVALALLPLLLGHRGFLLQLQRSPGAAPARHPCERPLLLQHQRSSRPLAIHAE
eukprot:1191176-Heterocapsa_arctica.AAC.1